MITPQRLELRIEELLQQRMELTHEIRESKFQISWRDTALRQADEVREKMIKDRKYIETVAYVLAILLGISLVFNVILILK